MADPEFEHRLSRWYSETPVFADADGFAQRVERRLNRSWALRRAAIGAAGIVGGVFAAGQMLDARMFGQAIGATGASMQVASDGVEALGSLRLLSLLPVGAEVMWMGAGLAALALVLAATRALEEL